jgi:DNA-binding NarL/FixJ family response regulator
MAAAWHVLLVDDHALFREGLAHLLRDIDPQVTVSHAGSCDEAIARLGVPAGAPVSLILLDMAMPGRSGLDALRELRNGWPGVPVVVLSGTEDAQTVLRALDAGAMGFVPKSATPGALGRALETVLAGGVHLPALPALAPMSTPGVANTPHLTPRQRAVLALLLQGQPNKRIETALGLAAPTVKAHVSAVLHALGVTTRTQAVIAAGRLGLPWRTEAPTAARGNAPDR